MLAVVMLLPLTFASASAQGMRSVDVIVVLEDAANPSEVARQHRVEPRFVYEHALTGFAASIPEARLRGLENDPRVDYIELDDEVQLAAQTTPTGVQRIFAGSNSNLDIDADDDYRVDVDIAIIDTGIDLDHPDLNVVGGVSCLTTSGGGPPWARRYSCDTGGDDDHYHGTHVAGTAAALDNDIGVVGVAPGARLWAVKVLDSNGSGYESGIVAGIDWVAANADRIEVANMSLGGAGWSQAEYDAIQGAVDAGVAFAVAAGNSDADASKYSPAAFDNVLTTSALADFDGEPGKLGSPTCRTDTDDTLADFSNWGTAVDIAAPGVCIRSTFPIEEGGYGTISGTSMASPHVAGALGLLASRANPSNADDVTGLYSDVVNAGNFDWTDDSGDGDQEPLLDVWTFDPLLILDDGGGGEEPTDDPPSVSITAPNGGVTVSGTVTVIADANDDNGVEKVEFSADGTSIGVDEDAIDGWSVSWDTTTTGWDDGTYALTATATDTAMQTTESSSVSVTVDNSGDGSGGGSAAGSTHVADLDGTSINGGSTWTASVDVLVHDGSNVGAAVNDVSVAFAYISERGDPESVSCKTGTDGRCNVSAEFPKRDGSVTFTVIGGGVSVDDGHDPDGDSDGTSITVTKP